MLSTTTRTTSAIKVALALMNEMNSFSFLPVAGLAGAAVGVASDTLAPITVASLSFSSLPSGRRLDYGSGCYALPVA